MTGTEQPAWPAWAGRFLDTLRAGEGVRSACREAGVASATPYNLADRNEAFARAWREILPVDGRRKRKAGPKRHRDAARLDRFLDELARTSNVTAAAALADVQLSLVYKLRRADPDFARRWYSALAEGYDNLEMDLLARLREGRMEEIDDEGNRRKFDFATALRCLSAHRENVAREKGRRTLADEAATIASINAKIDALRARAKEGDARVRKSKKALSARTKRDAKG